MKRTHLSSFAILLSLFLVLETCCRLGAVDVRIVTPPSAVVARIFELLVSEPNFRLHVAASAKRYLLGILVSLVTALPLAALAGIYAPSRFFLSSLLGLFYPLPKSAIFPFFLLFFGLNDSANVALIASGCVTLLLASLIAGCGRLESSGYFALARSLRLSKLRTLRSVVAPGLLPELFQGLKLGSGFALVLLIVSEMIGTRYGLGVMMWAAWDQFHIVDIYAAFYIVGLYGIFSFAFFDILTERVIDSQRGL